MWSLKCLPNVESWGGGRSLLRDLDSYSFTVRMPPSTATKQPALRGSIVDCLVVNDHYSLVMLTRHHTPQM